MKTALKGMGWCAAGAATIALVASCGGGGAESNAAVQEQAKKVVVIGPLQPNVVARWNEIATTTINATGLPAVTEEERRPVSAADHATVHVAIYDAVNAITGTHKRYAASPVTSPTGASQEAAVISAAYNVLSRLFPNRAVHYQAAYDADIAALPAGDARTRGIAVGREVAVAITALRASDGRWTDVTPVVPGTLPGQFRGVNPVGQTNKYIRPFGVVSNDQFRADGPPPLDSTAYAEDFQEVKEMGGTVSAKRTAAQLENARFHTESPANFPPRNYRSFAAANQSIADNARLMAMIWVAMSDGGNACFDSKYHFYYWRPQSAILLAGTDGNAATEADPAWTPVVPTPNHPEYPSAHACVNGAAGEAIAAFYGTKWVRYSFNSTVTGTTHTYDSTDDMIKEMQVARIHGGMHFRTATVHGAVIGMKVGKWIAKHHFTPVD